MSDYFPINQNYIGGVFRKSVDQFDVFNPADHKLLGQAPVATMADVDEAIAVARAAQPAWAKTPAIERARHLNRIASRIRDNQESLAQMIVLEQGKTAGLAEIEVNFTADYIDYMAEWARRIEGEIISSDRVGEQIFLFRKPLGVAVGILPWNFPFFLIARKMAPALLTGNTIVIKPSEETPLNCFAFARLVAQTDLPAGVFNVVGGAGSIGAALSGHNGIDMVSFTGSVETGARIMSAASGNLTKLNLELGGKAPAIVLDDANLDLAVKAIHTSRVINAGQVCNCAERVYVQRGVAQEFTERVAKAMASTRYGNPGIEPQLDMGPLINRAALDKVAGMVRDAIADGASVVTGGAMAELASGYHYQPTVLSDCRTDMPIMKNEIFGPVLPIQVIDDLDEAIALANNSQYGLTSSIYTRNLNLALQAVRELDFGETYINRENFEAMQGHHAGVRHSGVGGADGKHGLYEYMHSHVVYVQT